MYELATSEKKKLRSYSTEKKFIVRAYREPADDPWTMSAYMVFAMCVCYRTRH